MIKPRQALYSFFSCEYKEYGCCRVRRQPLLQTSFSKLQNMFNEITNWHTGHAIALTFGGAARFCKAAYGW